MNKTFKCLSILTLLGTLIACVDKEKNKLDNRVADYWKYKINKEFDKTYEFLSPGWKASEELNIYQQRMIASKVNWTEAKLNKKECEQVNFCTVYSDIEYEFNLKASGNNLMKVPTIVSEKWILKDNTWYLVPEKKNIR